MSWKSPVFSVFLLSICVTTFSQTKTAAHPVKNSKPPADSKIANNIYADIDKKALLIPDSLTRTAQGIADYIK